jgi:hypothetical protein
MRRPEVQGQPFVQAGAARIEKIAVRGAPGFGQGAKNGHRDGGYRGTRDAHDADAATAGGRGNRCNRAGRD